MRTLEWKHVREDTIRLAEEHSKTDEARDFPLAGIAAAIIARWRAKRVPVCPFVFHRDGRPLSYESWRSAWQRAAIKVGLGTFDPSRKRYKYEGINLHDARRSFVTDTMDAGVDVQTTMLLSGHKTDAMVKRYRIPTREVLARAIEKRERYVESRTTEPQKVAVLAERRRQKVAEKSHNPAEIKQKAQ